MSSIRVETIKVGGRKYIEISDLICWLHNDGNINKEIIAELERLKQVKSEVKDE